MSTTSIKFSKVVWGQVLDRLDQRYVCSTWEKEIEEGVRRYRGISMQARLGRITMATAVCCVWQEHNNRIFVNRCCIVDGVVRNIEEFVRAKKWNWQCPRTYMNWFMCRKWGVADDRVLV